MNLTQNTVHGLLFIFAMMFSWYVTAAPVDSVLQAYQQQGAGKFDTARGKAFWRKSYSAAKKPQKRSCETCHGKNMNQSGEHVKSGKEIKPMAPSVNAERYTKAKKIEKWFKRNCKYTLGRVCTPQEKGDVLSYLKTL